MDFSKAVEVLSQSQRQQQDIEALSFYLACFQDYRKYTENLNSVLKFRLCRSFKLETVDQGEVIYKRGYHSQKWYLLISGQVELYTDIESGKIFALVDTGKQFGEWEMLRSTNRFLSAVASKPSKLIILSQLSFLQLLGPQLQHELNNKLAFVQKNLPFIRSYSIRYKQRVAYCLSLHQHKRGDVILQEGNISSQLHFVYDGEASIQNKQKKTIVNLGRGTCFAQECIFLGQPSSFNLRISSEFAVIASIKRSALLSILPQQTIQALKKSYQLKKQGRKVLVSLSKQRKQKEKASVEFKSATCKARKQILNFVRRNRPSTPRSIVKVLQRDFQESKLWLSELRACSPSRIEKRSGRRTPEVRRCLQLRRTNFSRMKHRENIFLYY